MHSNKSIQKAYDPKEVEAYWYSFCEDKGCFKASANADKEPYVILIPPPNVTGSLTMGHVLNNTLQDVLVRRARQEGKSVLWQPGTDHAGIATQVKVEKEIYKQEGKKKHDFSREAFVEKIKNWRDTHGGVIIEQLKRLGASCDWSRLVHTLDEDYSHSVLTAFVELFKRGYIYRGKRMVNWCPSSLTALSDEEVIMKAQKSTLYTVKYELCDTPEQYLLVATTRPETIMGDVALAVHPSDERYQGLIGQNVWRPLSRTKIPILADEAVDPTFGSGVLKVTPAHDALDFEIGMRHGLALISVIDQKGHLNAFAGKEFEGIERFEARKIAAKKLKELGLLEKEEIYENNVGFSERSDVPIEPRVSEQWFLKYPKVEEAKRVVQKGMIKFWPQRWEKTYLYWLENIQDWCISRQLWWGHRIPVWYRKGADRSNPSNWHVSVQGPKDPDNWEQEEDVLDTWASSWLWPFATLGWPEEANMQALRLHYFYPTSVLVTGPDIIFFWVARMIMASLELMGPKKDQLTDQELEACVPFKDVYFTGIVRDSQGRKMSKSLGNSPDPIKLIDKYGADGLRFGILSIAPQGQDVSFSEERIAQGRNFCNKLWNAFRYRQMAGPLYNNASVEAIVKRIEPTLLNTQDIAIIFKVIEAVDAVKKLFKKYEFSAITDLLYNLFWTEYCDWYIEVSKIRSQDEALKDHCLSVQDFVLREVLLLLHPFMPFITEQLWCDFGYGAKEELIENHCLEDKKTLAELFDNFQLKLDPEALQEVEALKELISKGRNLKATFNLASKKGLQFCYKTDPAKEHFFEKNRQIITYLLGASRLEKVLANLKDTPAIITSVGTLGLVLKDGIVDLSAEKLRLNEELKRLEKIIANTQSRLKDEAFIQKAPQQIVKGARRQLEEAQVKYDEMKKILDYMA